MSSLKLKFKIEILAKILKTYTLEEFSYLSKAHESKSKLKPHSAKNSEKHSVRSSKIINTDYENIPGFDQEMSKLQIEEKEEIQSLIKNYDFNTLTNIFTILISKKFYFKLRTKLGLDILKNIFYEILRNKSEDNINLQDTIFINDECELFFCLKDFINITELDSMDLFDLFKFNDYFAFTEQSFILLIYLLSANECGNLEDYFNLFSEDIFTYISGGEKFVSINRVKDLGRILGFNERQLYKMANDLKIDIMTLLDYVKFKEFYSTSARTYDDQVKLMVQNVAISQSSSGKKSTKVGCMSKACNIL